MGCGILRLVRLCVGRSGMSYGAVQGRVNQEMGLGRLNDATVEQLRVGVSFLERWLDELHRP